MVVTAMVNDENSQEQETITSCDHVFDFHVRPVRKRNVGARCSKLD